jgi:hypothetical protein
MWSETLPKAFYTLWALQRACEVQVASAALGPCTPISKEVQQRCAVDARNLNTCVGIGEDGFDAMVRVIDRVDRSWRD